LIAYTKKKQKNMNSFRYTKSVHEFYEHLKQASPIWAQLIKKKNGKFVGTNIKALADVFGVPITKRVDDLAFKVMRKMVYWTFKDPDRIELDGFEDGDGPKRGYPHFRQWTVFYDEEEWPNKYGHYMNPGHYEDVLSGQYKYFEFYSDDGEKDLSVMAKLACMYKWAGKHRNVTQFAGVTKTGVLLYMPNIGGTLSDYPRSGYMPAFKPDKRTLADGLFSGISHLHKKGFRDVMHLDSVSIGRVVAEFSQRSGASATPRVFFDFFEDLDRICFSDGPLRVLFPENACQSSSDEQENDIMNAAWQLYHVLPGRFDLTSRFEKEPGLTAERAFQIARETLDLEDARRLNLALVADSLKKSATLAPELRQSDEIQRSTVFDILKTRLAVFDSDSDDDGEPASKRQRTAAAAAAALVRTRGDVAAAVELLRL
jgi:hypothetical protein